MSKYGKRLGSRERRRMRKGLRPQAVMPPNPDAAPRTHRRVSEGELSAFLTDYPRPLTRDLVTICEPLLTQWNDFTLGGWPSSVVASRSESGCWITEARGEAIGR